MGDRETLEYDKAEDEEAVEEIVEEIISSENAGTRIDVYLAGIFDHLSRSFIQKLIGDGYITVNGTRVKANYKLKAGELVRVEIPYTEELEVSAEPIPLEILYEDRDVIVINKPQGMVVHPAPGNYSGTLVNALLWHCKDLSGINGVMRPGIVHRLDKDTSGVIMAAKNDETHASLAKQIKDRTVTRRYLALIHGVIPEPAGIIEAPIGRDPKDRKKMAVTTKNSRPAVTHYKVLERFNKYTFVECKLETGRTHQIRVHMAYLKYPVVGDPVYGPAKNEFGQTGQLLHAHILGFHHPRTGEYLEFKAPLPEYFNNILSKLRG
ncbi:RluA family pseudouridine synthase [Thermincola ferriacetica]